MFKGTQFDTCFAGELGIQTQYLDRERDFVDDALAGRLFAAPQFQVIQRVVQAITILVMDVFAFVQRSTKRFHHHSAVLKFFPATTQVKPTIASRMHVSVRVDGTPAAPFVTAFARTKSLLVVVVGMLAVFGLAKLTFAYLATKFACKKWRWSTRASEFVHGHLLISFPRRVKEIV